MASDELKNTALGTVLMLALAGIAAFMRITGQPIFELLFEATLFYLPLALLVGYLAYQVVRKPSAAAPAP